MKAIKPLVLIVDDVEENQLVVGNILFPKGIDIMVTSSGQQALERIALRKPDLILLDIAMPEMDGYEVCKRLKANPKTEPIPIIFLTARNDPQDVVKGFDLGAVDYITKPFNQSELFARVKTHLELKHSRDVIEQQTLELKEISATKDRFFSIIAHDLKNPFNNLVNYLQLLLQNINKYDLKKIEDTVRMLFNSAKQGNDLLENLLNWSLSQTGKLKCTPQVVDLEMLFEETVTFFRSASSSKDIFMYKIVYSNTMVLADPDMTRTIIRNLVSNAIKYTDKGGEITLSAEDEGDNVEITITDTGVGLSKEEINKLFKIDKPFSKPGTANERGTGLGLILCKEFIEKNGGKLRVVSEPDRGSEFIFTLPKAKNTINSD